jgi:hypothetical protein
MALEGGEVQKKPDLACMGMVSAVGQSHLSNSEKAYYYVLPIEVTGKFAAPQKLVYFLLFRPEWFTKDHKAIHILDGTTEGEQHYRRYRQDISTKLRDGSGERIRGSRPSTLQAILGEEKFAEFAAEFDELESEPDDQMVGQIIARHLIGTDVVYVAEQRKDGDELMESYNVNRFVEQTEDALAFLAKDSANPKRKRGPLVVTWDEN